MNTATTEEVKDPALVSALATVDKATALAIRTPEESAAAQEFLKEIARVKKNAEAVLQPPVDTAHEAWKKNVAHRDKYLVPLDNAKKACSAKIGAYLAEEQRKADEARRVAEQKALEEQLARQKADAEAKAAQAASLAKAGLHEEANAAMEEAVEIEQAAPEPVYVAPMKIEKAKGVALVETWDFEITDEAKIPREYLAVDLVKLRKVVVALKKGCNIPGVRAFPKFGVSARAS